MLANLNTLATSNNAFVLLVNIGVSIGAQDILFCILLQQHIQQLDVTSHA